MSWNPTDYDPDWPFELQATSFTLEPESTALLVIDLQPSQYTLSVDSELAKKHPQIVAYWNDRLERCVFPNTKRLLDYFRTHGMTVVFTRNGCVTPTGREVAARLRPKKRLTGGYRGTSNYEIADCLAPGQDEIVLDKLTSGAFTCTWLDHALQNMGIRYLVLAGIASDMCVIGTARPAAELGYYTLICEDSCAAYTEQAHIEAMLMHARKFGRVGQCQDIIAELEQRRASRSMDCRGSSR